MTDATIRKLAYALDLPADVVARMTWNELEAHRQRLEQAVIDARLTQVIGDAAEAN